MVTETVSAVRSAVTERSHSAPFWGSVEREPRSLMTNPQGVPCVPGYTYATSRNMHSEVAQAIRVRWSAVPSPAVAPLGANVTATPEPWQRLARLVADTHAAVASRLHVGRLGLGHHRIRDVFVAPLEDRVVESAVAHSPTGYTHPKAHGAFARNAKRRGEELVLCGGCGKRWAS